MRSPILILAAVCTLTAAAQAAPVVWVSEGVRPGPQTGGPNPAVHLAEFQHLPGPSSIDLINGITPTQIDARLRHDGGGLLELAKFSDGIANADYPGQLPQDYPGINVPAVSLFWALPSPQSIGAVDIYSYNYNNDTEGDNRAWTIASIYTTTDAVPSPGGTWTALIEKAGPSGFPIGINVNTVDAVVPLTSANNYRGTGIRVKDDASATLAANITGVRVDYYASGFGNTLRNPLNSGVGDQAVSSPILVEVDVWAVGASVDDWMMF
jgi:hypothetical protein